MFGLSVIVLALLFSRWVVKSEDLGNDVLSYGDDMGSGSLGMLQNSSYPGHVNLTFFSQHSITAVETFKESGETSSAVVVDHSQIYVWGSSAMGLLGSSAPARTSTPILTLRVQHPERIVGISGNSINSLIALLEDTDTLRRRVIGMGALMPLCLGSSGHTFVWQNLTFPQQDSNLSHISLSENGGVVSGTPPHIYTCSSETQWPSTISLVSPAMAHASYLDADTSMLPWSNPNVTLTFLKAFPKKDYQNVIAVFSGPDTVPILYGISDAELFEGSNQPILQPITLYPSDLAAVRNVVPSCMGQTCCWLVRYSESSGRVSEVLSSSNHDTSTRLGRNITFYNKDQPSPIDLGEMSATMEILSVAVLSFSVLILSEDGGLYGFGENALLLLGSGVPPVDHPIRLFSFLSNIKFSSIGVATSSHHLLFVARQFLCDGLIPGAEGVCSGRGQCVSEDQCQCDEDYSGSSSIDCSYYECYGVSSTLESEVCSGGHGECVAPDDCFCSSLTYDGEQCEHSICFGLSEFLTAENESIACYGHGICHPPSSCICEADFYGEQCTDRVEGKATFRSSERLEILVSYDVFYQQLPEAVPHDSSFSCEEVILPNIAVLFGQSQTETSLDDLVSCSFVTDSTSSVQKSSEVKIVSLLANLPFTIEPGEEFEIYILGSANFSYVEGRTRVWVTIVATDFAWVIPTVVSSAFVGLCLVGVVVVLVLACLLRYRFRLKQFKSLGSLDILLAEERAADNYMVSLDPDLFSIELSAVKIKDIIGQGGSSTIVYSAEWDGRAVAYVIFEYWALIAVFNP